MTINKKILPLIILVGLLLLAAVIKMNPPAAPQQRSPGGPAMVVETLSVTPRDYSVALESYGIIQPRTRSMLVAQVEGQIVDLNPNLRDGGFFERGDVLVTIDSRDYSADVRIAEATLADARQTLAEADARSNQAREDWSRLGNEGDIPDLVLRVPQLEAAKARVLSAESSLQKAKLDFERTRIRAPFAGRVLAKFVDLGQVVSRNTQLAEIFATDIVEIRLPIRNRDLPFIDLPEVYRNSGESAVRGGRVEIRSELAGRASWEGELVRTEGAIDEAARQLHVIAQIGDPFAPPAAGQTPLKIGQYVTAKLEGKTVPGALVIPNNAIYQGTYVYIVEDGILARRDIDILWQNENEAIVSSGLAEGDQLVTTSLGQVTSGIRVAVSGENDGPRPRRGSGEGK
ncbi:MAG: efflux RND transporter periplasmic adaptor subunit [Gammaproteobacteria bacterium]|nr:efflux RND transporter periplasmic adaptor subunit [Gammaproteobacteria bacterium]